jgi:hypothetical protein
MRHKILLRQTIKPNQDYLSKERGVSYFWTGVHMDCALVLENDRTYEYKIETTHKHMGINADRFRCFGTIY